MCLLFFSKNSFQLLFNLKSISPLHVIAAFAFSLFLAVFVRLARMFQRRQVAFAKLAAHVFPAFVLLNRYFMQLLMISSC